METKNLVILRVNLMANNKDMKAIWEYVESSIKTGLLILPSYIEPIVVPGDVEIQIEPGQASMATKLLRKGFDDIYLRKHKEEGAESDES